MGFQLLGFHKKCPLREGAFERWYISWQEDQVLPVPGPATIRHLTVSLSLITLRWFNVIHVMKNMRHDNSTISFGAMDLGSASTHDDINIIVLLLNRLVLIIVIISRFR